jgi:hypothetical protein
MWWATNTRQRHWLPWKPESGLEPKQLFKTTDSNQNSFCYSKSSHFCKYFHCVCNFLSHPDDMLFPVSPLRGLSGLGKADFLFAFDNAQTPLVHFPYGARGTCSQASWSSFYFYLANSSFKPSFLQKKFSCHIRDLKIPDFALKLPMWLRTAMESYLGHSDIC